MYGTCKGEFTVCTVPVKENVRYVRYFFSENVRYCTVFLMEVYGKMYGIFIKPLWPPCIYMYIHIYISTLPLWSGPVHVLRQDRDPDREQDGLQALQPHRPGTEI